MNVNYLLAHGPNHASARPDAKGKEARIGWNTSHTYKKASIGIHLCVHVYIYIYRHSYVYIYVYVYIYIYIYAYIHIYIYVYVCMA